MLLSVGATGELHVALPVSSISPSGDPASPQVFRSGRAGPWARDGQLPWTLWSGLVDGRDSIDLAFGELRPSTWRQAVDLGNMMLTLGLRVGSRLGVRPGCPELRSARGRGSLRRLRLGPPSPGSCTGSWTSSARTCSLSSARLRPTTRRSPSSAGACGGSGWRCSPPPRPWPPWSSSSPTCAPASPLLRSPARQGSAEQDVGDRPAERLRREHPGGPAQAEDQLRPPGQPQFVPQLLAKPG